jgi:hypothetical protein
MMRIVVDITPSGWSFFTQEDIVTTMAGALRRLMSQMSVYELRIARQSVLVTVEVDSYIRSLGLDKADGIEAAVRRIAAPPAEEVGTASVTPKFIPSDG